MFFVNLCHIIPSLAHYNFIIVLIQIFVNFKHFLYYIFIFPLHCRKSQPYIPVPEHCLLYTSTIAHCKGKSVPVAVWDIKPIDEMRLDRYEGYPSHYFKQDVSVKMNNGEELSAMVYIMDLKQKFGDVYKRQE